MAKNITKAQIVYIQQNWNKLSLQQLVEDTECSLSTIKKYIKELSLSEVEQVNNVAQVNNEVVERNSNNRAINAFGYGGKQSGNGGHQATIMTPGASEIGDDSRKSNGDKKPLPPHIHKLRK